MLFRRENDGEAITIYRNGVGLFFAVSFNPPTAIRSPQLYPTGPPAAAKRRRAAPWGGVPLSNRQEKGSVERAGGGDKQRYFIAVLYNANE